MFKNALVWSIMMLMLTACGHRNDEPLPKRVEKTRKLPYFNRIMVRGATDVVIKQLRRGSNVKVIGDSRSVSRMKTTVANNTLYVQVDERAPVYGPLLVQISTNRLLDLDYVGRGNVFAKNFKTSLVDMHLGAKGNVNLEGKWGLRRLHVEGKGKVRIKGVSSKKLAVVLRGSPEVKLAGVANLSDLRYNGRGQLALFWLDSPDLRVRGYGDATVHLAGTVRFLHVNLHDASEMDGRYLRVNKAYVQTYDRSVARLQPILELNAHASGGSNIYYYNEPHFKAKYMSQNGAILAMYRYW